MAGFKRATKKAAKLRLAFVGPPGSGKTYTALSIAKHLGGRVALIDTEHGSASKYADLFTFDALELATFSPATYVDSIREAEAAGYDVLVVDSLSHAWSGKDGALDQVDKAAARSKSGNSFAAWREVTPQHNALVEALIAAKLHLIVTMRSKVEWVIDEDDRGKKVPRKVGLAPVQRDGVEYEFDVVGDMDQSNRLVVSKSRCPALSGGVFHRPGKEVADVLKTWLTDGVEPESTTDAAASATPTNGTNGPKPGLSRVDAKAQQLADRIRELADDVHGPAAAEYLARVLMSLGRKHRERFELVEGVPVDELERWVAKLESEV